MKVLLLFFILFSSLSVEATQFEEPLTLEEIAFYNAVKAATAGPDKIKLLDQGILDLPEEYLFIPPAEAKAFLNSFGNLTDEKLVGIIFPKSGANWFIGIEYYKQGYINEEEAKNWDVKALFKSLKEGTLEDNKYRLKKGYPTLTIEGWEQKPTYDALNHKLVWSILISSNHDNEKATSINYNTYALGREGYFKLMLVTEATNLKDDKIHAEKILTSLNYIEGKRYEDFQAGIDAVAKYGLSALIVGAVAKKAGLLATLAIFVVKSWKILVGALLLLGSRLQYMKEKIKQLFQKKQ